MPGLNETTQLRPRHQFRPLRPESGESISTCFNRWRLDGRTAYAEFDAADEKNREGNAVQIRDDLAADLRAWLADKLALLHQAIARRADEPIPSRLPAESRFCVVQKELVKFLNRGLKLTGISKEDGRGRTIDVHAQRATFSTLLRKKAHLPSR
jgi:hypothetical protein